MGKGRCDESLDSGHAKEPHLSIALPVTDVRLRLGGEPDVNAMAKQVNPAREEVLHPLVAEQISQLSQLVEVLGGQIGQEGEVVGGGGSGDEHVLQQRRTERACECQGFTDLLLAGSSEEFGETSRAVQFVVQEVAQGTGETRRDGQGRSGGLHRAVVPFSISYCIVPG